MARPGQGPGHLRVPRADHAHPDLGRAHGSSAGCSSVRARTAPAPSACCRPLADGVKLALKEDIVPAAAEKVVYVAAPGIACALAFVSFSIIPFGPNVSIAGAQHPAAAHRHPGRRHLRAGRAPASASTASCWRVGRPAPRTRCSAACARPRRSSATRSRWACRSWPSSSTPARCRRRRSSPRRSDLWFIIPAFFSFVVYVITMFGETNRLPFDLAEGEGELTGGFRTEYSSLKFALFFLAEYVNMVTVSALATTLFLGGWRAPWPLSPGRRRRAQHRLVARALVRHQALDVPLRVRLGARLAAPGALRPVHAVRLEVPHPGEPGVDRRGRRHPGRAPVHRDQPHADLRASSACWRSSAWRSAGSPTRVRPRPTGPVAAGTWVRSTRSPAVTPCRRCRARTRCSRAARRPGEEPTER